MPRLEGDFDIDALHAALDEARRARGLSWQALTHEINDQFAGIPAGRISVSTIRDMRGRTSIEGDGVLQALRWLGREPERFVPGWPHESRPLPALDNGHILRFDTIAIYARLDARRSERRQTWTQVAGEIGGVTADGLRRLSAGGRISFPNVMRIAHWLGVPAAALTRASRT